MVKTISGLELNEKLAKGVNTLAESVSSTLGPSGRNVLIYEEDGTIKITKDGVTVAKSFTKLEDPVENIGMQLIKKVSEKAVDKAGDGTTTATVLAASMINSGLNVINDGANNIEVKKGIDKAVKIVVNHLKSISDEISAEQLKQVATISGNNDSEIGTLISEALNKVGVDGIVYIEESKTGTTVLEEVEGMQFDRGLKSPFFVTDNHLMQATLENPYIFMTDEKLMTSKQIINLLNAVANENRSLLIVADDVDGEALPVLVVNKSRGVVRVAAVKAPEYGDRKLAVLEDMAILTGGTVVSKTKGHNLEKIEITDFKKYLGQARMVTSDAKETTIIDGKGDAEKIAERCAEIKAQLDKSKSQFETEILQGRLSKLSGGVAIIHVGGLSEIEMKEKKDRVDDALHATKAALLEGIVPGAGMALIECATELFSPENEGSFTNEDQILGRDIVNKSLFAPFKTILRNAGINSNQVLRDIKGGRVSQEAKIFGKRVEYDIKWLPSIFDKESVWNGYNVKTEEYCDLKEAGVLDPTKVTRTAIEQAASVAGTVLTAHSSVYAAPQEKKQEDLDLSDYM